LISFRKYHFLIWMRCKQIVGNEVIIININGSKYKKHRNLEILFMYEWTNRKIACFLIHLHHLCHTYESSDTDHHHVITDHDHWMPLHQYSCRSGEHCKSGALPLSCRSRNTNATCGVEESLLGMAIRFRMFLPIEVRYQSGSGPQIWVPESFTMNLDACGRPFICWDLVRFKLSEARLCSIERCVAPFRQLLLPTEAK
jgi:hypothetical protein